MPIGQKSHDELELDVEHLEPRRMLAGDVSAKIAGGDLVITGDGAGNYVRLDVISVPNESDKVRILPDLDTRINGASGGAFFSVDEITDDLRINLRGGDDTLILLGLDFTGGLSASLGAGNDVVSMTNGNMFGQDSQLKTGSGNNSLYIDNNIITGNLKIASGPGIDNVDLWSTSVASRIDIRTSGGDDTVKVLGSSATQLKVTTGGGEDAVDVSMLDTPDELVVVTGAGDDSVGITSVFVDQLKVTLGGGDDAFTHLGSGVATIAKLNGGGGSDTIYAPMFSSPLAIDLRITSIEDSVLF